MKKLEFEARKKAIDSKIENLTNEILDLQKEVKKTQEKAKNWRNEVSKQVKGQKQDYE
jgi:predicted  nucleic acid-binding Zn-ribbon protein